MNDQIEKIDELVHFPGKKIKCYEVKRLTAPGENYGSIMLSVDITLETAGGTEKISLVAKTVPPNEFIQEVFNTTVTFGNEIAFYNHIVPTLQNFQTENGVRKLIDFSPKYYGSRMNLTGGDKVDKNAILVLENLKVQNFLTLDSTAGLDLATAKLILADLAHLHAVPLAYKLKKPADFAKNIRPFFTPWRLSIHEEAKKLLCQVVDQIAHLRPLKQRLIQGYDKMKDFYPPREPFATVYHNDCWTNNNMVKFEGVTPIKNKIVDYQISGYGSPAKDVVFFIFSSVKSDVVKNNYDDLVRWYHEIFISVLEELSCDTKPFTLEALREEIDFEARNSEFGHVTFMLFPIFAKKTNVKDVTKMSAQNIFSADVTDLHKEKLVFVVEEFIRRNWV